MLLNPQEIKKIKTALSKAKNIVVIPHKNPDGDAMGAVLALRSILNDLGINTDTVSPNDFPPFLKFLPFSDDFINAELDPNLAQEKIEKADIIFLLDFNESSRTDQLKDSIDSSNAMKILIDHHQHPNKFDIMISRTDLPATCEMVYHFIIEMGWKPFISKEVATLLMTGILTDTGMFRYSSVKESTFHTAGELTSLGAKPYKIQDKLLDNVSPNRYALLSTFLNNMTYLPNLRTSIFTISREELEKNGYVKGDTDGFVNYGLNITNNVFSIFLSEDTQKEMIKISFRSKGNFDVSAFARKHFEGGGHINAAGGKSDLSLEKTKEKILNLLNDYKNKLQSTDI